MNYETGQNMAINLNGKKTSLEEEADIYQKRSDKESEREKIKKMNGKEKRSYFAAYYLPKLLIILAVLSVVFYLLWADVINKRDIILRCAVLNESITDSALTEFGDSFVTSIGENPDKTAASFYAYYTRSDLAAEFGGNAANDLSEITSRIAACDLGCMIASEEDGKNYLDNGFFLELKDFLTEEEYSSLSSAMYTAPDGEEIKAGAYGIRLDDSPVYQALVKDSKTKIEHPVFSIITNADDETKEYARKLIHYVFPDIF
jgi:hypothetical protein